MTIEFLDEEVSEPTATTQPSTRRIVFAGEEDVIEQPQRPVGTSFSQEVSQLGPAFIESLGRPLENMGEGFEAVGFQGVANALKGAVTEPENYVSAAQRFMEPEPGESQFLGFAWQYAPRAAVEQVGQALGSMTSRAAGAAAGGVVAGPPGAVAGAFVGPAIFGAAQVIGPVAKERARNNGREVPNNQDLAAATLTAIGSGALDAIGARYLPGGDKATGKFFKRVASSFLGEAATEAPQAITEQIGSTAGTEAGLNINVKQAIGEGLIGGTTGAGISAVTYPLTKDPERQVIRTPEQVEEINIDAKANEEAINLMGQPGDEKRTELITKINEIERVVANNETLINGLEPNDDTRKQLELENRLVKQEGERLKAELQNTVGLQPVEQRQIELAKQIAAPVEPVPPAPAPAAQEGANGMNLQEISESAIAAFPDMMEAEGGLLPLTRFTPDEQASLRKAGIVETATTSTGETYEGVNSEYLWQRRNQLQQERAAKLKQAPAAPVEPTPAEAPAITPTSAAERVVPITEPTEAVEDIEAGAPPLSTENLYFENNLAQRAWRIAAGFKYDKERGDWFHPSYPDLSRGNAEQEINDTNPPTQTQVRAVLDQLRQKYTPAIKEVAPTEVATFQKGDMVRVPNRVPVYEKGEVVGGRTVMVGGSVTRVMPDGKVEVRLQQGGYATLLPAQIEMRKKAPTPVTTPPITEAVTPAPAIKRMAAPVRVEEKVQPVPEAERYTFEEAGIRAIEFFGGKAPDGLLIVNDTVNPNYKMKAGYDSETGEIIVNRAYIKKGESIEDILTHELGHYIYSDPQFQADFKNFLESMPDDTRAEIEAIINQSYNKDTNQTQIEERQVMAFTALVKASKETLSAWENLKNTIKRWINKVLKTNIKLSDEGAMAVFNVGFKRFKSGERIIREMEEGTLKMAAEPRKRAAEEKPITDPATPEEQTQQQVQAAQEQESIVDSAVKEAGATVFDVFNRLVNEGKTEEQVSQELGISKFEVRKLKLRADTAILNKMKQKKVQPLAFQPKNPVVDFAEKNAKKYFTKEGWLPKMVYQSWVKRNAALSREQKEAEYAIKDLYDGIRKVFGISKMEMITKGLVSVPPDFVQQLNDALAGQIDINTMPEPVREPLTRMRQHIDTMSRQLVDLNVLPDDLAAKISDNLGVYLTRSYKIFTDKNWINKIPQEKLNNARNFLYKQQLKSDPTATIEMADRELRNMLNDWASEAEGLRKRGGKLGAKDLSVMMKRAEVPKVLRDVMGENMNVVFNYANTIGKISRFLADQRFLNEVKAKGTGQFLFTAADAPQGFNTQIAAEESRTMSPLNGLRTTPEIAKAFEEFGKGYDARENPALYALGWLNAVGKLNLTVGSILTQMRNILGQPAFFVFNGHYNWAVIRQEVDAIAKDKGISKEDAKRELIKQAAAQGLVNENAYAGELRTAFQEVGLETFDDAGPDEFVKEFVLTRMFKQGVRSAQDLYQKTDEFGKLVGWLNETKRIQRMNKGMDKATAQSIAAERTRDTYPTYSQSSEALRLFRRQPFIGPFATFFYETFRTSFHNLRYAFEDMKGPTPEHRAEGRKRLAGAMAQLSAGAFAVNLISQALSNIGDDEEEDVRRMLPPWAKDASILWMPKSKDGTYNFINLSYINPYNALTDPFIAMMSGFAKGEKPEEIATQAFGSFLSPFVDEQPVSAAIVDAMRNRTETGKQVYNPQDDIATKTSKIMLHIFGKTFTPGTLARLNQRIIPAIEGETVGTRAPAPVREVTAELTGIRFETLDMKAAFSNKAWEFSKAANESERIFRDIATRRRRVNEQEQIDAYRRSEQTRYEIWNEMYRDYMAVRRAGASQSEAIRLMTDIGISKKEAQAIARGRYTPYEVSDEVKRRSKLNGNTVPLTQIKAIGREMPKVLTDITTE